MGVPSCGREFIPLFSADTALRSGSGPCTKTKTHEIVIDIYMLPVGSSLKCSPPLFQASSVVPVAGMSGRDPSFVEHELFMRSQTHAKSSHPRQPWEQPGMLCV